MFFCTVHCNIIIQYIPTKLTFSKLIYTYIYIYLIFDVFYMFSTRVFIFRKAVVYRVMER